MHFLSLFVMVENRSEKTLNEEGGGGGGFDELIILACEMGFWNQTDTHLLLSFHVQPSQRAGLV